MLKLIALVGAVLVLGIDGSLFCPHTAYPSSDDSFRSMMMQKKEREGQEPMYRITDLDNTDQSFTKTATPFKLMTRTDNSECPGRGCITELSAAMPKHQGSILYLTNIMGKLIPPGFNVIEVKNRLYCTIIRGDCGSSIPIYRYYKFTPNGLYHAYSTDDDEIPGFTRETMPLCYAWHIEDEKEDEAGTVMREGSGEELNDGLTEDEREEIENDTLEMKEVVCDTKSSKEPPRDSMKPLNVWKNNKAGSFVDHYYTTNKPEESDYEYDDTVGLVVVDQAKSKCTCLMRLTQMVDNKTEGLWARLDHKLISDYLEPMPNAGEEYESLPEEVFCVKEEGACGATLPLRKFFKIGELDTVYTVNDPKTPMFGIPTPPGVLCYIWPAGEDDLPEEAMEEDEEEEEKKETVTKKEEKKTKKEEVKKVDEKKKGSQKTTELKKNEKKTTVTPKEKATTAAPKKKTTEASHAEEATTAHPKAKITTMKAKAAEKATEAPKKPKLTTPAPEEKTTVAQKKTKKPTKKEEKATDAPKVEATTVEAKTEEPTTVTPKKATPAPKTEEKASKKKAESKDKPKKEKATTTETPTTVAPKKEEKKTEKVEDTTTVKPKKEEKKAEETKATTTLKPKTEKSETKSEKKPSETESVESKSTETAKTD